MQQTTELQSMKETETGLKRQNGQLCKNSRRRQSSTFNNTRNDQTEDQQEIKDLANTVDQVDPANTYKSLHPRNGRIHIFLV